MESKSANFSNEAEMREGPMDLDRERTGLQVVLDAQRLNLDISKELMKSLSAIRDRLLGPMEEKPCAGETDIPLGKLGQLNEAADNQRYVLNVMSAIISDIGNAI
jgi:hypothetical protein